jgi:ubiquinone/menaquinone biosynthesis C-methylase UbiE
MDFDNLSKRYYGGKAKGYDSARESSRQWANEQAAVEALLGTLPEGRIVVDVPVGTARFAEIYLRRGDIVTGVDASTDMLRAAADKIGTVGLTMQLKAGDIRALDAADESFDVAVCIRFLNWIDLAGVRTAILELKRVSRKHLIVGVRHFVPASEIGLLSPSGLSRYSRQFLRRTKTAVIGNNRPKILVHEKAGVASVFDECGLSVARKICVDSSRNGTDYNIYLLAKAA